uniref:BMP family ABC transporter substrate-binding protein n=1 Tax=Ndongobacter massiliensis TaxID=1871025 RepID=UPI0009300B4E|nr:BMP family ABC transporter substrate-binding protein [Ndongobacter massiliensis]
MLKKFGNIFTLLLAIVVLTACGGGNKEGESKADGSKTAGNENKPSFAFIVTDQLGDKSFNDSAAEGTKRIAEELGYETKIMEIGRDQTKWEPTILDVSESGQYTAIFLNGSGTKEIVEQIAGDYPNQKYVLFDADIEEGKYDNVFAIRYKQNEGSYLGGVVAGLVTSSKEMPNANPEPKIGFIGGDENPIISDFLVGYIEGAKSVLPDVKVYVSYVGSWSDTAKAKELANAQFAKGVDIIFPAAMTAGLGVVEAAAEQQKYVIGVDSDQASLLAETDPEKAEVILTSVIKNVGESLFQYAKTVGDGTDKYGTTEVLGVKEKSTDIVENDFYKKNVPQSIQDAVSKAREQIMNGEVKVSTALGVEQEEVDKIVNSVQP